MKTIIWVLMGVLVGVTSRARRTRVVALRTLIVACATTASVSFAQYDADGNYFNDPNLIDDSLPPDQVSAVPFKGYNPRRIEAEEIQPEVAVQVYELSKWLKEVYDHVQKQER